MLKQEKVKSTHILLFVTDSKYVVYAMHLKQLEEYTRTPEQDELISLLAPKLFINVTELQLKTKQSNSDIPYEQVEHTYTYNKSFIYVVGVTKNTQEKVVYKVIEGANIVGRYVAKHYDILQEDLIYILQHEDITPLNIKLNEQEQQGLYLQGLIKPILPLYT